MQIAEGTEKETNVGRPALSRGGSEYFLREKPGQNRTVGLAPCASVSPRCSVCGRPRTRCLWIVEAVRAPRASLGLGSPSRLYVCSPRALPTASGAGTGTVLLLRTRTPQRRAAALLSRVTRQARSRAGLTPGSRGPHHLLAPPEEASSGGSGVPGVPGVPVRALEKSGPRRRVACAGGLSGRCRWGRSLSPTPCSFPRPVVPRLAMRCRCAFVCFSLPFAPFSPPAALQLCPGLALIPGWCGSSGTDTFVIVCPLSLSLSRSV